MSKHTPGPWRWRDADNGTGEQCIKAPDGSHVVCLGHDGGPANIENDADARLIVAAPRLLAAAKAILTAFPPLRRADHLVPTAIEALALAVAEAEGRTQTDHEDSGSRSRRG